MSLPTLHEIQRDYEDGDTLSFVVSYTDEQEPVYPPSAAAFMACYDRRPLSEGWDPPPVIIEREEQRTDIYELEGGFAISQRAKQALSRLVGPYVEFLPVNVVGERDTDASDRNHKPITRSARLYLINPLVEVELGKGSISHKMAYRHITKYVFHPDDVRDLPIFRAKEDLCILVSDSFCQLVKSKGLRGLQFEDAFEWEASTARASIDASIRAFRNPPRRVDPPELIPENELSGAKKMTNEWW